MPSRIAQVRDAAAAKLVAAWNPTLPDKVLTTYRDDTDAGKVLGRRVCVFPNTAASPEPANRGEDVFDWSLAFVIGERFTEQGDPTEDWVDQRVEFTEWLWRTMGNPRSPNLLPVDGEPYSGLFPVNATIEIVYDLDMLAQEKLFISQVNITYREAVAP